MNWKPCVWFLLSLLIAIVKSDSYIEVDENGDEYEVKRFHIQGRQLNDTNPTCVVTRRKRATTPQYGIDPADESYEPIFEDEELNEEEDNEEYDESKDTMPQSNRNNTNSKDEAMYLDELLSQDVKPTYANITIVPETLQQETVKPNVQEVHIDKEKDKVPNMDTTKPKSRKKLQKVTLIFPQQSQSEITAEAQEEKVENENAVNAHNIVLIPQPSIQILPAAGNNYVLAEKPQPSNNLMHEVSQIFNILPTQSSYEIPISVSYEKNPTSTYAVWSTGDDVPKRPFNRADEDNGENVNEVIEYVDTEALPQEVDNGENVGELPGNQGIDQGTEEIVTSGGQNPGASAGAVATGTDGGAGSAGSSGGSTSAGSNGSGVSSVGGGKPTAAATSGGTSGASGSNKPRPRPRPRPRPQKGNKKPQKKNKKKKKKKKKYKIISRPNRKHRPHKTVIRYRPQRRTTKRPSTQRRRPSQQKQKKRKSTKPASSLYSPQSQRVTNKKRLPGAFTSTETRSTTSDGENPNIECIIINKPLSSSPSTSTSTSSTTTTRRPFWNILGRNVDNVGEPRREYGNRKRVMLRFRG